MVINMFIFFKYYRNIILLKIFKKKKKVDVNKFNLNWQNQKSFVAVYLFLYTL